MPSMPAGQFTRTALCGGIAIIFFVITTGSAEALPPRSERVTARMAERVYARQAIAEARAVRAESRAAEMAKLVPEPPPPRPLTLRRMARAGVPPIGQPQTAIAAKAMPPEARVTLQPPPPAAVRPVPAAAAPTAALSGPTPLADVWTIDADPTGGPAIVDDGTRSVLATGGESPPRPVPSETADRPGPAVTQPPIELLPTPSSP